MRGHFACWWLEQVPCLLGVPEVSGPELRMQVPGPAHRGGLAWCSAPHHHATLGDPGQEHLGRGFEGVARVVLQPDACFHGRACVVGPEPGQLPRTAWPICSPACHAPGSRKVILGLAGLVGAEPPWWFWIWVVPGGTCPAGNTIRPSSGSWVTALAWPPRVGAGHKGTAPPGPGPRP